MSEVRSKFYPVVVETRVIIPTREQLDAFSFAELERYAEGIGVKPSKTKKETIDRLLESGKATILAQLGD
jgi:hypothetical protein